MLEPSATKTVTLPLASIKHSGIYY